MLKRVLAVLGYVGATAFVVLVTYTLVSYGNGYRYSFKAGKFYETGLIIVQSLPSAIPVTLDGKDTEKRTPYRVSLESGKSYEFKLALEGYHSWTKRLSTIAREVTLAQYIYLIPLKPATRTVDTKAQITAPQLSPDGNTLAYIGTGEQSGVYTVDTSDRNASPKLIYQAQVATDAQPGESLTSVDWSSDSKRLLIQSSVGDVVTHRLSLLNSDAPVNLTAQYGFNLSGIKFAGNDATRLYWISPDGLRRLDTGNKSVSGVIAGDVSQFSIEGDRVLFVQTTQLGRSLQSLNTNGDIDRVIQSLPDSPSYSIDAGKYDDIDRVVVVPASTGIATLYSNVYQDSMESREVARDVTTASFSPDSHLLMVSSALKVRTYDLERSDVDSRVVNYDFSTPTSPITQIRWFDNFHVLITQGDRLVWSEYDGANQVDLGQQNIGLPGISSSDLRRVYSFRTVNQSTQLIQITTRP